MAHASSCSGGCFWGRSNLGWEREDAGLMIAFDFVILAVIALSGNLKDSVWKCSQIITTIQKEGKIVFLPVRMESAIKNTPEPPSPFLLGRATSCPALRNSLQPLRGQPGDSPTARLCWCGLGGISQSELLLLTDLPAIGDGRQGLLWRGGGGRSRREGKGLTCLAFMCHVASVGWTPVADSVSHGHPRSRMSSQGSSCLHESTGELLSPPPKRPVERR